MFFSEPIASHHELESFDSEEPDLDQWLRESALHANTAGTARVRVLVTESHETAGYYAIAPHLVRSGEIPAKVGRGMPDPVPAILLGKLALDRRFKGSGHGAELLADAIRSCLHAIEVVGGRVIVVDALHTKAAAFYEHFGFKAFPEVPLRLYAKPRVVVKALALRGE